MKQIIFFSVLLLFSFCRDKDKCKGVECGEYGSCDDGNCDCPSFAYQINGLCDGRYIDNFIGSYATTSSFCDGSFPQGTALTCSRGGNDAEISVQFGGANKVFELIGQVSQNGVSFSDQSSQGYTWTGSGSISGNLLSLNITRKSQGSADCTYSILGTK